MQFHEKLLQLRKERGLSQEELGYRLGVTRQTVSKWELGQTTPEMDKLIEMSALFGVSIDALVGKSEQETVKNFIYPPFTYHYEYKSKRRLFGIPLVHINIGRGFYKAKGVVAIGNIACGIVSLGLVSVGLLSFGALALGLLALGALAVGGAALGGCALGVLAMGGIAVGMLAIGGAACGMYAIGGAAVASDIALGGYASGHIAIGDTALGEFAWENFDKLTAVDFDEIRNVIVREYPGLPEWLLRLFVR